MLIFFSFFSKIPVIEYGNVFDVLGKSISMSVTLRTICGFRRFEPLSSGVAAIAAFVPTSSSSSSFTIRWCIRDMRRSTIESISRPDRPPPLCDELADEPAAELPGRANSSGSLSDVSEICKKNETG